MVKRKSSSKPILKVESDSVYFLKLIMFFMLGAFWLRISLDSGRIISLPVGFFVGLLFASHEHFQIDRKIELAVLLVSVALSAYIPIVGLWV